jgi:hypothetical protein
MGSITTAATRVVPTQQATVAIDGNTLRACRADAIERNHGGTASVCDLSFPAAFAGPPLLALHGRQVDVTDGGRLLFRGYIQADTAQESADASEVNVRAYDAMALLDRVYFGQATLRGETVLPAGGPWTLGAVLQLALGPYSLPPEWLSLVSLGDVSSLGPFVNMTFPDQRFTGATVQEALRRILGLIPGASMRCRYIPGGGSVVDFFRFAISARVRNVRIPINDGPEDGATITAWSRQTGSAGLRTRVLAYGDLYRLQVTFREIDTPPALVPAWDGATIITDDDPSAGEEIILANPQKAIEGSPLYSSLYGLAFRVYQIDPALFEAINLDSRNLAFDTATGDQLPVQIFRPRYVLEPGETAGEMIAAVVSGEFEILEGARLDAETGYIILPRPAVYVSRTYSGTGGELVKVYSRAPVYMTATATMRGVPVSSGGVILNTSRGGYDTGQRAFTGIRAIEAVGNVYSFVNSDARAWSLGTGPGGIVDANGAARELSTIWLDPGTGDWLTANGDIVVDDRPALANLAEAALQEHLRPRSEITIRLPYVAKGWHAGDPFRVLGRGVDGYVFTTAQVLIDVQGMSTEVRGSDLITPFSSLRLR